MKNHPLKALESQRDRERDIDLHIARRDMDEERIISQIIPTVPHVLLPGSSGRTITIAGHHSVAEWEERWSCSEGPAARGVVSEHEPHHLVLIPGEVAATAAPVEVPQITHHPQVPVVVPGVVGAATQAQNARAVAHHVRDVRVVVALEHELWEQRLGRLIVVQGVLLYPFCLRPARLFIDNGQLFDGKGVLCDREISDFERRNKGQKRKGEKKSCILLWLIKNIFVFFFFFGCCLDF